MVGLQAFAAWDTSTKIEVDGLYYYLDNVNNLAQVTSKPSGKYTGNITIPSSFTYNTTNYSVTNIGSSAFQYCHGLTSVTIPNSVTSIGNNAFQGCEVLTPVTIPNSVTSIGDNAFNGCHGFTSITIPNSVKSIGQYAFNSCTGITSITIPNSLTSIGNYAFSNCTGLTSVTIPNSMKSIGTGVFSRTGFTSITIPTSVTSIGDNAFNGCSSLESITIPSSVTSIGGYAFSGCSSLESISIPSSVTSIGRSAFSECSGLESITISNGVTTIGLGAFAVCTSLESITIPKSVTSIGSLVFSECHSLTSISVEAGNTTYDSRNDCNAIITTASNTLLAGCKNTVIPNSVTSIGSYAFDACTGLTSITIPNSVTRIGQDAFHNCSGLTSITIPNTVTSIGQYAFQGCTELTSITIPNSVTSIGNSAFSGCTGLTSVTVDISSPLTITSSTFSNRTNATLHVPEGCTSAYEAADYWKEFKEIVEIIPDYVTIAMKTGSGSPRNMIAYSSKYALDFTDRPELKAYIACGYNSKKEVMLVHVKVVPPYTGMVIKTTNGIYDGGEYDVPTTTEDYYYANLLVPVVETGTVTPTETINDVEYTNFTIGTLDGGGIGFVKLTTNWTAHNKSYLRVPTSLYENTSYARAIRGFGVEFVEGEKATAILNAKHEIQEDEGDYYDLLGRKVKPNRQGLYIHKGKKVFIK